MQVIYLHVNFFLKFERTVFADTNPLFVLRSMMGKNLHSMCCISKKSTCSDCLYNKTCAYSYLFETILPQDNSTLPGRNRGSHPFSFSEKQNFNNKKQIDTLDFTLTLFGKAIDYLPYIYASFVRAGKDGIFKSRTKFEITKVCCNGKEILIGENKLNTDFECCEWKGGENVFEQHTEKEVLVELRSPLRFKVNGKYTKDFSAVDFMKCLYRRAKTLCQLYGEFDLQFDEYILNNSIIMEEKSLVWRDTLHYSARQKVP